MLHSKGQLSLTVSWLLNEEIILDYPSGPNVITVSLKLTEGDRRVRTRKTAVGERLDLLLLPLKVEEEATSQGMWTAFRSWKKQENR